MNIIIVIFTLLIIIKHSANEKEEKLDESEAAEQLFKNLFKRRRVEQLQAVKSMRKSLNKEKQVSMINLMAEKIFLVIQESRALLESSSYIPGISQFPSDERTREALSNILENTALFADVTLRFPNAASLFLKANNNWDVLLQWSLAFSNEVAYLLDKSTLKLLHLVRQELNYIEKEADYINPYRDKEGMLPSVKESAKTKKKKKIVKKEAKTGPTNSYRHSEL